jgi:hypothetical protein
MSFNPYKRLMDLLPDKPLLVGQVLSISNGVATIQEPGGGLTTARGTATVGQRVFFRDGSIEGVAPNLTYVSIDV